MPSMFPRSVCAVARAVPDRSLHGLLAWHAHWATENGITAADPAGTFICLAVGVLLLFHLLVNVGMVIGRMPVTGIPLPLMSYGGSSMFTVFLMLGLVNNVRLRRFVN